MTRFPSFGPNPQAILGGPSTDNAVARWDGTTGDQLQNSGVTIDDSNNVLGVNELTVEVINSGVSLSISSNLLLTGSLDVGGDITTVGLVDGRDVGNMSLVAQNQDIYYPQCFDQSAAVTVSDTAYFMYLGRAVGPLLIPFVSFTVEGTAAGAASPGEVGLFTTPLAAGNGNQTLTRVQATGTISALNVTGEIRNTAAFTTAFANGDHMWFGLRTATVAPQPNCRTVFGRSQRHFVLTMAAAGALTAGADPKTFAGVAPAFTTGSVSPFMFGKKV